MRTSLALCTCLSLCCCLYLPLCKSESKNTLQVHFGGGKFALRDKSVSPLLYQNAALSFFLAYKHEGPKKSDFFQLNTNRAVLSNQYGNTMLYRDFCFKNYSLYKTGQARLKWGWSNNNYLIFCEIPSYGNFNKRLSYVTSFGPALCYVECFNLFGKQLKAELPLDLQVLGFYIRPSYVSDSPEAYLAPNGNRISAFLASAGAFLPNQAWNAALNPGFSYILSSGNAVVIQYHYEYLCINRPEKLSKSSGIWTIGIKAML